MMPTRDTALSHYLRQGQKSNGFRPDSYKSHDLDTLCDLCGGSLYDLDVKGLYDERNRRYQALYKDYEKAKSEGKTHKVWHKSGGYNTRISHMSANGQKVGIDEMFDVGGETLFLPNDPNASLDETANCRCTVGYMGEVNHNHETYVMPGEERTDHLISSRTFREDPVDIFLPEGHGYSVISIRMTSLGNNISASKIPLSKLKRPKSGGNSIIIELRGFGSKFDKTVPYSLDFAKTEIKFFAIHPRWSGVIMIQGATYAPIEVDVAGYTYYPTYNLE